MRLLDLNRSKLGSLLAISIILFSLLGSVEPSKAYTSYSVIKGNNIVNTQRVSCVLTNGKFAYVTTNFATNKVNISVYDANGLDGFQSYTDAYPYYPLGFSVIGVNDTVFVMLEQHASTSHYLRMLILNTTTYSFSTVQMGLAMPDTAHSCRPISNLLVYDGYIFGLYSGDYSCYYFRYRISDTSHILTSFGSFIFRDQVFGFQPENYPQLSYWMASDPSDLTKPVYMAWDLSTYTSSFEVLATHPYIDDFGYGEYGYYTRFLGGGIYIDGAGKYYLYFTWAWTEDCYVELIQHRLRFTSAGIHTANLEDQNRGVDIIFTTSYGIVTPYFTNIPCGFLISKEDMTVYYANYHYSTDSFYTTKQHVVITSNWTDFGGSCTTTVTNTEASSTELVINLYWGDRAWKNPQSSWEVRELWYGSPPSYYQAYVYYGFLPSQRSYVLTWSWIPSGDLYTSTQYLWSLTLTMNGVVESGASITIKFDNTTLSTKQTNAYGLCDFTMLTTIGGFHRFSFVIYDANEYQDTKTEDTVFYTLEGEGEGIGFIDTTTQGLFTLIPIFLVVLLPAFVIASFLGVFGFVIGLIVGGICGTVAGILPASAFLLIVLVVAVFLVLVFSVSKKSSGDL